MPGKIWQSAVEMLLVFPLGGLVCKGWTAGKAQVCPFLMHTWANLHKCSEIQAGAVSWVVHGSVNHLK